MSSRVKVALVDDNKTFLEGLEALLDTDERFDVKAKFTSGRQIVNYDELGNIDLLLLDVEMPDLNGIQTAKLINFSNPEIKIIAITMYQDKVYLTQLIESGFTGFVNKTNVSDELFSTIDVILNGELSFPENIN